MLVHINNVAYNFERPMTVLEACDLTKIPLPRFCYHTGLSESGNCRICLVSVEGMAKPAAACVTPITQGMKVHTNRPQEDKLRQSVMELLLMNHPLDCPVCPQGGECDLQDLADYFGTPMGRFYDYKRAVEDKVCGPLVKTSMTRCIQWYENLNKDLWPLISTVE